MIILLSPAKTLDYDTQINNISYSIPTFLSKSKDWLTEMVSVLQQDNVGAVGPKLLFGGNKQLNANNYLYITRNIFIFLDNESFDGRGLYKEKF